jgi:hypothetical protein
LRGRSVRKENKMEVTLLLEASENAYRILERAREHAIGLLDTAVEFLAEETKYCDEKSSVYRCAKKENPISEFCGNCRYPVCVLGIAFREV